MSGVPSKAEPLDGNDGSSVSRVGATKLTATASRGRKRRSLDTEPPTTYKRGKKAKTASDEAQAEAQAESRPRLTTPDLEFDYDRAKLRDQRPTPGRVNRPRLRDGAVDDEFKQRFYIPEITRPKGMSKNDDRFFAMQALADSSYTFHDLHVCHKKGPNGTPTYDAGGFQLDWAKVDNWMKPRACSKRGAVNGMTRRLEKAAKEQATMRRVFFTDGKGPDSGARPMVENYLKDHISKDLGVPWHQIDEKQVLKWEQKGFPKMNADWWHQPNEEEEKRMSNMIEGASLRKDM
ncbi:hypothetical protein G7Z17_g583 [Cylindrodendrum hubeiense]|uniref:Uncharacterized protein n=1 Tax=Cylindrodendrum hubeiense TaxID=595255 RepID=A0A9P5HPN5_9HYPO|nr:hypothetical protein G7Z17_g583 [Cylindrodendrum hubeiense]